ncbi:MULTISPECIES: hypothetical protein [unclassified Nonomuraea]|uniref:hypothetical protein n=1 Tax=unclassified Nonomuraea TaxID=2593643 RepID=UPI0033E64134
MLRRLPAGTIVAAMCLRGSAGARLPGEFGPNVAMADPTLIARVITAWPSFTLIGRRVIGYQGHDPVTCLYAFNLWS